MAQLRTALIDMPMLEKEIGPVTVTGTIASIDLQKQDYDAKLVLKDVQVEGLTPENTPGTVRLRLRKDYNVRVGDRISALAELMPLSEPVAPGAFNFRRYMFYKGIGAVGFIYKDVERIEPAKTGFFSQSLEGIRFYISQSAYAALPDRQAAIVSALLVGKRSGIDKDDEEALRHAGLAHLLAISGLHVGLVCGAVFFFLRFLMALIPPLALHHPIKKYSAFCAIIAGFVYMMLAGSTIPTQRAFMMTSIVFLAIIVDRSPFSLRLVAFAAIIVLLFTPDALLSASFQLSFAAVTALIAFYEQMRPFLMKWNRKVGPIKKAAFYFIGVTVTSFIAGMATAPFALYHFHQMALYGVVSNFVAIPLMAFVIMPAGIVSLLLMPVGLDDLTLTLMGRGIDVILDVAHWTEALDGAIMRVPSFPFESFILFVVGTLFFILVKGPAKCGGLFLILAGFYALSFNEVPRMLIAGSHDLIAVKTDDNEIALSSKRREKFVAKNWIESWGHDPHQSIKIEDLKDASCDDEGCRLTLSGKNISLNPAPYSYRRECVWADVMVVREPVTMPCKAQVIDRLDSWRHGAYALYWDHKNTDVTTRRVRDELGWRPWNLNPPE